MAIKLIKKNVIGERAFHLFEKDGVRIIEPCTLEEYDALGKPNPKNPTKDGYIWCHSYKTWLYDTPSGELEDNCYVLCGDQVFVKLVGKEPEWLSDRLILNDELL